MAGSDIAEQRGEMLPLQTGLSSLGTPPLDQTLALDPHGHHSGEVGDALSPASKAYPKLKRFDLFGWRPDPYLSDDENYMDVVLLITRHSVCDWQGHMGSLIVEPRVGPAAPRPLYQDPVDGGAQGAEEGGDDKEVCRLERRLFDAIIGAATNSPLYGTDDSDIHAEIDALGQACRSGLSTEGCTAYITMPPCRRCFAALVTFGITRIVSRKLPPEPIRRVAGERGIAVVELSQEVRRRQMERINGLTNTSRTDEELMRIAADRKRRKEERQRRALEKQSAKNED